MPSGRSKSRIPSRGSRARPGTARLDAINDTSGTSSGIAPGRPSRPDKFEDFEPLEPIAKELRPTDAVTWDDVKRYWKVIVAVSVAAGAILPTIYWIGGRNTEITKDISALQTDVKDVKSKTDRVLDQSKENSIRLSNVEKDVSGVRSELRDRAGQSTRR